MPYSVQQCRKFGAMARRGEKVPADWKKHCRKGATKKPTKRKR